MSVSHYVVTTEFAAEWSGIVCSCGWKTRTYFSEVANRRFRKHADDCEPASAMAVKDDPAFQEFPQ